MSKSTRMIGLIMTAALWAAVAAAQGPPMSHSDGSMPEELSLPLPLPDDEMESNLPAPSPSLLDDEQSMMTHPTGDSSVPFDGYEAEAHKHFGPDAHGMWYGPTAPIESTGTWLRRGFWYAEADAVIWNRMWNRDDKIFAAQDQNVENPLFFLQGFLNTNRLLILNASNPGQDASVRTTLGHFLFRDAKNRDHTAEFTVLGGGEWEQNRVIASEGNFGLFVPFTEDGGNRSFDQSTRQTLDYSSHYKSFEGNYRVKSRLRRDQMVMDSNGNWHRAANASFVKEYLAGLRFLELRDRLDWRAEDIQNGTSQELANDGSYVVLTDNDLFGPQLGAGLAYEAPRWSLGAHVKGGVFVNDAIGRTTLNFTLDDTDDADLRFVENELSFVGEFKLQSRFHITPNVSLRAAYEMMYIESVALAPSQVTFITDFSYLNTTGDPFYHGASFGLEGFW